ncbi:hypothetical protein [Rhodococcus pyridinivorans]|uniref:hypothetical protein n=1 Tax=Rhodococcus pyridinivorans TaxID=103816 RepID=UPI0022852ADE|nr:hypothetical protein [Rhodococcus pyridinivorans]WAL49562.1 hypothetical protein OQN32_27550 [Rhodococcus pyridinivorans]
MKLKEYWDALPGRGKCLFWVSLTVGVALFVLGVVGDVRSWWSGWGFVANILTSLVGALIGVPFAVVGVGWFTANHQDRIEGGAAAKTTRKAWENFKTSVLVCTNPLITGTLTSDASKVDAAYEELANYHKQVLAALKHDSPTSAPRYVLSPESGLTSEQVQNGLRERALQLRQSMIHIRGAIGNEAEFTRDWSVLQSRWTFLSTHVRILRTGAGLSWIPVQHEMEFHYRLSDASPLRSVSYKLDRYEKVAADVLKEAENLDFTVFVLSPSMNSALDSPGMVATAQPVREILLDLRQAALDADQDNWIQHGEIATTR